ncbi:hypothetical protein [Spirosoma foliorum]|uniref:Xylose isomerase-like TIM barrel domain-containing protein n=1 Tax=Spirosoma foliorum TaxID=2710596 RepID=A0A7G5H117_9BACT|nr:hypothetical protein [Spirosoma foliorum]QMW04809.1 hypothetical protein H3H32_07775 [Spirosoma foliorum]
MGKLFLLFPALTLLLVVSAIAQPEKKQLVVKDYPDLRVGFSTQNFQKAMPMTVESLTELMEYAAKEGYSFIELRDDQAMLSAADCKALAKVAQQNKLEVIYEIQKNVLDSGYFDVFKRGLANTLFFPKPGILRALLSKSEFEADSVKKGWTKAELTQLIKLSDRCAAMAKQQHIQFILENLNEPFFGNGSTYFGLQDFFKGTTNVGFQFDIGNPFRNSSKVKANPEKVATYLATMRNRWITSHFKTLNLGESQPILTDNPLSVNTVIELMGKQNIRYVTIELLPAADKQQCFSNHARSIQFLKDKGIFK